MAIPTYGYNKDTDYQKLIEEAVAAGDMARAAIYEAQRNEKIAGEGLQYGATSQYANYLPGSYEGKGYENPYLEDMNAAIGRMTDTSAFKKGYLREADRSMEDTIGQYGTMTGGLPSTQAVAAASQAADYTKSQMGEKLAELERQNVGVLMNAGAQAQSEYQMMISEALNRWQQLGYADDQVAQILGVTVGTPTSDQSYINWQKGQQDKSDAYNMAMALLQAGQMPSTETLAAAGISTQDAQSIMSSYGSKGTYKGGNTKGKSFSEEQLQTLAAMARDADEKGDWTMYDQERSMYYFLGYDIAMLDEWLALNRIGVGGRNAGGFQGGYTSGEVTPVVKP